MDSTIETSEISRTIETESQDYMKDNHHSVCKNPNSFGYPTEDPVAFICLSCGSWNWKK